MDGKEHREIGEVFRDRFKGHESVLNEESWSKISERLPINKNYNDSFKNEISNPRFITGVIIGALITSIAFLIINPKAAKENDLTIAQNSIVDISNNSNNNSEKKISDQESSFDKNISNETNIYDSQNKTYTIRKGTEKENLVNESNTTEISSKNSEYNSSLSNQHKESKNNPNTYYKNKELTEEKSPEKNHNGDHKKSVNSLNSISDNSRINDINIDSPSNNKNIALTQEKEKSTDIKTKNIKAELPSENNSNADDENNPVLSKNTSQNINKNIPVNNSIPEKLINSDLKNSSPDSKANDDKLSSIPGNVNIEENHNISFKNNSTLTDSNTGSSIQNNISQPFIEKTSEASIKNKEQKLSIHDKNVSLKNSVSDTQKLSNPLESTSQLKSKNPEDNLISENANIANNKVKADSTSSIIKPAEKTDIQEYKSTSKLNVSPQSKFILGYYFSPESSFRKLSASSENQKQVTERNNNEKVKIGYSTGITVGYKLSNKLIVTSGLNVVNVGEKGTYLYDSANTTFKNYTNNYTYVGIPVLAGYKIGKGRLGTIINSGLIFNALVNAATTNNGDSYYDGDDIKSQPAPSKNDDDEDHSKGYRKLALVYTGNIEFNYQLYKKLSLQVGPTFKYFLTSIYEKSHSMKSRPYSMGLMAGVKFYF